MRLRKKNPTISPAYKSKEIKMTSSDDWRTPDWLFDKVITEFPLAVDRAADEANTKLPFFITKEENALLTEWQMNSWANIPYSSPAGWYKHAFESVQKWGITAVLLVKADTSTKYWAEYTKHAEVRFLKGRVKFWDENNKPHHSANFPSALVIFTPKTLSKPSMSMWDYTGEKAIKLW